VCLLLLHRQSAGNLRRANAPNCAVKKSGAITTAQLKDQDYPALTW
jgi:hypothetical protein